MNEENPDTLAPIPHMSPGVAVGGSSSTKDPESGQITKRNYMAQCAIPHDVLMVPAIDSMQDKEAQAKFIELFKANQAHAFEEDSKAHERQEIRNDKKAEVENHGRVQNRWFGYIFIILGFAISLVLRCYSLLSTLDIGVALFFVTILGIAIMNGRLLSISASKKSASNDAHVAVSDTTESH